MKKEIKKKTVVKKETPQKKIKKLRGKNYVAAKKQLDPHKTYSYDEAIKLLRKISISSFNASVDLHVVVKEIGVHGEIEFPHPTGKSAVIALANEATLKKIENNKIDFTVLVATPAQMGQLVKYAKILGPKGLMPNPKNGTISDQPEETVKKLAGKTSFKTELKAPLIHVTIGKVRDAEKDLTANLTTVITAIGKSHIVKAVLAPSMGPGIKLDVSGPTD